MNTTTPTAFKVGTTYATRSACDHDCIFRFEVTGRTAKRLTFNYHGTSHTRGIRVRDGIETCLPFGSYSMAPVISAEKAEA